MWSTAMSFFFSSRRRHTRCSRDWSSDVCSSDLLVDGLPGTRRQAPRIRAVVADPLQVEEERLVLRQRRPLGPPRRSEERRVGKSVDLGGRRIIKKKKK